MNMIYIHINIIVFISFHILLYYIYISYYRTYYLLYIYAKLLHLYRFASEART